MKIRIIISIIGLLILASVHVIINKTHSELAWEIVPLWSIIYFGYTLLIIKKFLKL